MELAKGLNNLDFKVILKENLTRIMKDRDLTQQDLSKLSGVKQATISHILTMRRGTSYDTIADLCKALKIEHHELTSHPRLLVAAENMNKYKEEIK
jgi:transcriptional regulator with XRE-family HTH domain